MAEATANEVKVEDAGPARKRLTITIPAETIAEKIDDSMATLIAKTSLPGFRQGRAPRHLLERRFEVATRPRTSYWPTPTPARSRPKRSSRWANRNRSSPWTI